MYPFALFLISALLLAACAGGGVGQEANAGDAPGRTGQLDGVRVENAGELFGRAEELEGQLVVVSSHFWSDGFCHGLSDRSLYEETAWVPLVIIPGEIPPDVALQLQRSGPHLLNCPGNDAHKVDGLSKLEVKALPVQATGRLYISDDIGPWLDLIDMTALPSAVSP